MQQRVSQDFDNYVNSLNGVEVPPEINFAIREQFNVVRQLAEQKGQMIYAVAYARDPVFQVDPVPLGTWRQSGDQYCNSIINLAAPRQVPPPTVPAILPAVSRSTGPFHHLEQELRGAYLKPVIDGINKLLADFRAAAIWIVTNVFDVQEFTQRAEIAYNTFRVGVEALQRRFERIKVVINQKLDKMEGVEVPEFVSFLFREFPGQLFDLAERKAQSLLYQTRTRALIAPTDATPIGTWSILQIDYTSRFVTGF